MTRKLENNSFHKRNSHTVAKVLGPTTDFPTWESGKGTENLQGIWLWRPVGFDYRASTGLGKQTLGGHKKTLCPPETRRKQHDPAKDWARLACECPGVSGGGLGRQWPVTGLGVLNTTVLETVAGWHKSFWRRSPLLPWPLPGREHSPTHQQKKWIKDLLSMSLPSEQDPDSPTDSPSHQEASTSLISLSIRGQTEWKPQLQKTSQTDHMGHSLV